MSLLSISKKLFRRGVKRGEDTTHPERKPAKHKRTKKDDEKEAFKAVSDAKKAKKHPIGVSIIAGEIGLTAIVSEKAVGQHSDNIVVFRVQPSATKRDIAHAVREKYGTDVISVRVSSFRPKTRRRGYTTGRTTHWKKAYVKVSDSKAISTGP